MGLGLTAILLFLTSVPTLALTVKPGWIAKQLGSAPLVADVLIERKVCRADPIFHTMCRLSAKILSHSRWDPADGALPLAGEQISILQFGGERGKVGVVVPGFPRAYVGNQYRVYLKRHDSTAFEIAGLENGLISLSATDAWSRNRTDGSDGAGTGPFLYWADSYFPLPYFVSAPTFQGFPSFPSAIDASFKSWRDVRDAKIEYIGLGCTTATSVQNDGVNTVIYMNQNWPYESGIIALTRNFYISGDSEEAGMILDSDIMLNGVNHAFTTTGEIGKYDVQDIVTHEAGHVVGLGHETAPYDVDATMFATAAPNELTKRVLKEDDIDALRAGYAGSGKKYDFPHVLCTVADNAPSPGCATSHSKISPKPMALIAWFLFSCALTGLASKAAKARKVV